MMVLNDLLVICSLLVLAQYTYPIYAWTWECVNKRCVRSEIPEPEVSTNSLAVCRLTCGQYGALWPQPTGETSIGKKVLEFDPSIIKFDFSAVSGISETPVKEFMSAVSKLFINNLSHQCHETCSPVPKTSVAVHIATTSGDLTLNGQTNETYSLQITSTDNQVVVHIQSNTVYGVRHGLETLTQLTTYITSINHLVIIASAIVSDKPIYSYRGLLLDTSRNYLPLSALKRSIDAMATSKLNVLHWHVSDSHSFPLLLPRVPQLARFGAYSETEVYTLDDVKMLIKYARLRGVRIMLELDMPGHSGNGWQWGPEEGLGPLAICVNQEPWRDFCLQPPCGQLNPANPNLYKVLRDIYKDLKEVFTEGEMMHMGGDEVCFACWKHSKEITDWLESRGLLVSDSTLIDVWLDFNMKAMQLWDEEVGNSKTPIILWSNELTKYDVISQYLDNDRFVVEVWGESTQRLAPRLLNLGYRVIIAHQDAWYLNHGTPEGTFYHNWHKVYNHRLPDGDGVLGGEVAVWGELVDASNLDAKVWPRASAAAERLWANPDTDSMSAEYRLIELRNRLTHRGVQAEAITPEWCAENESECT